MGILRDLKKLNKLNNDLIRAEAKSVRNGTNNQMNIFDYNKILSEIDEFGFNEMGITFQNLMDINHKYDLRLSEEEISKVMQSEEPFYQFTLLPISRDILYNHIFKDLYVLIEINER